MKPKTKKDKSAITYPVVGFSAIQVMREIRDKISLEIMTMTYEEERAYLDKLLNEGQLQIKK